MKKLDDIERTLEILNVLAGPDIICNPGVSIILTLVKADIKDQALALNSLALQTNLSATSLRRYLQHLAMIGVIECALEGGHADVDTVVRLSPRTSAQARGYFLV